MIDVKNPYDGTSLYANSTIGIIIPEVVSTTKWTMVIIITIPGGGSSMHMVRDDCQAIGITKVMEL